MLWIYKSWGAKVYFLKKKIETKQKQKIRANYRRFSIINHNLSLFTFILSIFMLILPLCNQSLRFVKKNLGDYNKLTKGIN